jgi:uncharacterized repeat protein (TIGR01451 family)
MEPGIGVPRRSPWGAGAAFAIALLALALPLAAAEDPAPAPADTVGPGLIAVAVDPNPVVPDAVLVTATAQDLQEPIAAAEFFIDLPGLSGSSFFRMQPADGAWDELTEDLYRFDAYSAFVQGRAAGAHVLYAHAMDARGNWGDLLAYDFYIVDATRTGPNVQAVSASPTDVPRGADLAVEATVEDPWRGAVEAAELFFDVPGTDGTGVGMAAKDGTFDQPGEPVTWTGPVALPLGEHVVYVHGRARGLWGPPLGAAFTARAPAFTLNLLADRADARPGDLVTYTVLFENRGNANATRVWLNVTLPPSLEYVSDTVGDAGGTGVGTDYAFADVAPVPAAFTITARVAAGATDGAPLDVAASLDCANEGGGDFPRVFARATGSVVAPELAVTIAGPAVGHAGETVVLMITIEHTGVRTIPSVDVSLAASPWTTVVSDTTAAIGGASLGPGSWRLANVEPGVHAFEVEERVSVAAPDGTLVARTVDVSYVSRLGTPDATAADLEVRVTRPLLVLSVTADRADVEPGGRLAFLVAFENTGSAAAGSVEVRLTLPPGLAWVGGDPPTTALGGTLTWRRSAVTGAGQFRVIAEGRAEGVADAVAGLSYTSPNGADLGSLTATARVAVRSPPPPPAGAYASVTIAATASLLAAAIATERGKVAFLFLFLPLYTRLRHEHVLDHETRGMIRGYIVANPGDHYNSIKEALELPNGTLAYHIQVLQKESLVRSVKDGKFRRFYPFEMRVPMGGQPTKIQKVILDVIRTNPGVTPRDLAGLLRITSSTVSYHLEKLDDLGLVERRREGIAKRLYIKEGLDA